MDENLQTTAAPEPEDELARIQRELAQEQARFHPRTGPQEDRVPGITGVIIRLHLAQNEQQANIVMVIISLLSIATSVWLLWPTK